jgi:branched-chain amino acid transport system permease protein
MAQVLLQVIVSGLLLGFIYSLIAMGVTLIWGVMGFVNFAQADFMMLSMYIAYWMNSLFGVDPVISVPIGAIVLFVAGVVTYKLIISRVVGAAIAVQLFVTFGLMIFLRGSAQFLWTAEYRQIAETVVKGRLRIFGLFIGYPQLLAGLGAAVIDGLLYWFIQKTETGRSLRATAEDKEAASLMGIDGERMYALAWGLAVSCAGIAGGLLSTYYYVYPDVGAIFGLMALVIVAMAGFGNIPSAFLTSLFCGVVIALAGLFIGPSLKYAAFFVIFLIVILFRRAGAVTQ